MNDSNELRADGFFVVTGGPGAGKTTLLQELQKRRFACIPEVAREIIKEQVAVEGDALPWKNKELYLQMMFDRSVDSYRAAQSNNNSTVFFDRGIPDSLTYAEIIGFEKKRKQWILPRGITDTIKPYFSFLPGGTFIKPMMRESKAGKKQLLVLN
jgi:predicted ATPase